MSDLLGERLLDKARSIQSFLPAEPTSFAALAFAARKLTQRISARSMAWNIWKRVAVVVEIEFDVGSPMKPAQLLASTLITGSVASAVSTVTLAALAKMEGKSAAQQLNSTSHWLHGDNAARVGGVDAAHTGVGLATHHASALFWALPFETWLAVRPPQSSTELLRDAAVMSAIAAAVDYGITPKRLTPGWELTLYRQSMAGAFAGLALGLAAGAYISRQLRQN
jgi:hypothetical protein